MKAGTGQKRAEALRSARSNRVSRQHDPEGSRHGSSDAPIGTAEVALVGEAQLKTNVGQRSFGIEHKFAGLPYPETVNVVANSLPYTAAEHT